MSRIFVLGNAGMDVTLPVPRLPAAGETLVAGAPSRAPGGKGLNQAVVAARVGAAVRFMAPLGDDFEGGEVRRWLAREPFESLHPVLVSTATDLSVLLVAVDAENCIVSTCDAADALSPGDAAGFVSPMRSGDLLLVQGNLSHAATVAALKGARAQGGLTFLNPAPLRWDVADMLKLCGVVVANAGEAEAITGCSEMQAAVRLRRLGARVAVVTLGGDGCVVADAGGVRVYPAVDTTPVDTTGAGDAFCGVFAAMMAAGREVPVCMDAAQRAGALTVSRRGAYASLPDVSELRDIIAGA